MPTVASRILLAVEMLILGAPVLPVYVTLLFRWLDATGTADQREGHYWVIVLLIFIGSFLLAAYRVAFAFIYKGPGALRTIHKGWWWLSFGGAAYSILAVALASLGIRFGHNLDSGLEMTGFFGLFYLIPLAHILLERKFRKAQLHAA